MEPTKEKNIVESKGINQEILKEIIEDILLSKDGKVFSYEYLCNVYQIKDARTVRKYISAARTIFKAPIANTDGGYKKADTWDDYKDTFYTQIKHSISIIKTQNAVRKEFAIRNNLSLFDQSVFNTEFEDIIRIVDNYQEKKNGKTDR
jgi:predicted AAA+ superfamily ATPase